MMQKVSNSSFLLALTKSYNITEAMGDGEYEFADDGKLYNPPAVKLVSCKVKSTPAKGLVSIVIAPSSKGTISYMFLIDLFRT